MSILEWQCNELRRLADKMGGEEKVSVPFVRVLVIPIMLEAADSIEAMSAKMNAECENLIDPWSVHESFENDFECSACHASGHANGNIDHGEFLYCPRCGAKVRKAVDQ